jgi:hypothetical protein
VEQVEGGGFIVKIQIELENKLCHRHDFRAGPGKVVPHFLKPRRKADLCLVHLAALLSLTFCRCSADTLNSLMKSLARKTLLGIGALIGLSPRYY